MATASATAADSWTKKAADLIPKLDSIGFKMTQQGAPSASTSGVDAALAQYERTQPTPASARIEVRVFADQATAVAQFTTLSEALRNPPPDLFGPNSKQVDNTPAGPGEQSKSYITASADPQGNRVWTDAYRFGRAFVIVYTLGKDSPDMVQVRKTIGQAIGDLTK